jgi:hypothetical protein
VSLLLVARRISVVCGTRYVRSLRSHLRICILGNLWLVRRRSCVDTMFTCEVAVEGGFSPGVVPSAASASKATGVEELDQIHISSVILALNFWDSFFLLTTNTETESEAAIEFEMRRPSHKDGVFTNFHQGPSPYNFRGGVQEALQREECDHRCEIDTPQKNWLCWLQDSRGCCQRSQILQSVIHTDVEDWGRNCSTCMFWWTKFETL